MRYEDLTGNLKTLYDFHISGGTITIDGGTIDSVKGVFTLQEILDKNDDWWESEHSFIQWVYPTDEPSKFNPNAPIITKEFVELVHNSVALKTNISIFSRFRNYVYDTRCLEKPLNHNHLRFSRVLRFISLVAKEEDKDFSLIVLKKYTTDFNLLREDLLTSFKYWIDSCQARFK